MPDTNVVVQTSAAGVSVALDGAYQVVKLAAGDPGVTAHLGATTGVPAAGSTGLVVAVIPGVSVSAQVSGTVTINPTILTVNTAATIAGASVTIQQGASVQAVVSGTVTINPTTFTVNTAATVAGASVTIQQGASVQAVVSGAISISNVVPVTTAASVSVTGIPVWLNPTQGVNALVSISNVVPVTTAASVSVTALPVWLNPTQQVVISGFQGQSVQAVISGPVSISNVVPVTTAASVSVTGLPVWLNPTQQISISAVVPVTTAASVSVTGLPVWLNPTQQIAVSGLVGHSITGSVNIVSIAAVSISNVVPVTTQTSVSVTGLPIWFNPGALVAISGIAGVTTAASVSVTGLPVWLNPTQTIVVSGNVVATTTAVSGSTGGLVWLGASQTIIEYKFNPFLLMVTSTVGGSAGTTLLMTIYTEASQAAAGTTQWAVPSGKTLRLLNINAVINSSAVTGGTAQIFLNAATASGSFTSANQATIGRPMFLQLIVSAGITGGSIVGCFQDVGAGTTIGMFQVAATAMVIGNVQIMGYLF